MYTLESPAKAVAVSVSAPAKINLSLQVIARRDDGFHEISSHAVGIGLCDIVRVRRLNQPQITLSCDDPTLAGEDNLAHRAAAALRKSSGYAAGVHIDLLKRIPVGGGLGGGSSDAAATLRICNDLWDLNRSAPELTRIGAGLGSDVPLFFHLPAALMSGRGEHVHPVALRWTGWAALVFVGCHVSTAEVYGAWRPADAHLRATDLQGQLAAAATANELTPLLYNDLEAAVFRVSPRVAQAHHRLNNAGWGSWRVSGAGSALFRLFDDQEEALTVSTRVERELSLCTTVVQAPVSMPEIKHEEN